MKYKTVIKIYTDAENKDDAMDVAGEYLSGNIVSGVEMRCSTRPVVNNKKILFTLSVFVIFTTCVIVSTLMSPNSKGLAIVPSTGVDAVQAPLKTSCSQVANTEFKKKWEKKQLSEALNFIKK